MIITKEQDIAFMKATAQRIFAAVVLNDYGDDGLKNLMQITDTASNFYKYLHLDDSYEIQFYKSVDPLKSLSNLYPFDFNLVTDFSALAASSSKQFIVEVIDTNSIHLVYGKQINVNTLVADSVVYTFSKGNEIVFGKASQTALDKAPGVTSYFSMPTFKQLDEALEHYKIYVARRSNCDTMNKAWFDSSNRIFLKAGTPEEHFRKSLYYFLSRHFRAEVKEEQNVDDSKPVDIKISFDFSSHIAFIEVKWLGKSLTTLGQNNFNQTMTEADAVAGSNQLANYLQLHKPYSSSIVTRGYLVVFDARRWQTNTSTASINRSKGFHYENCNITFNPQHHIIRNDFATPVRFFIEPIISI